MIERYNIATLLLRKWKRACTEWRPATSALEELTAGSDPVKVAEWKEEAAAADEARLADPAAMDIYDVSATPSAIVYRLSFDELC